ncbi:hypothetical protein R5W23_005708 [Gemmata sp. JC673]|uniref:Uncharacterized protein n=1 Tax=Gemmata algarum TaxID=2975278 RepID=A0ABU5EVU4_9BACT|nr:hypothetical protein [Gemmata algarum]MDY3558587.1 hypothetical protein [Gemmata algarum]
MGTEDQSGVRLYILIHASDRTHFHSREVWQVGLYGARIVMVFFDTDKADAFIRGLGERGVNVERHGVLDKDEWTAIMVGAKNAGATHVAYNPSERIPKRIPIDVAILDNEFFG